MWSILSQLPLWLALWVVLGVFDRRRQLPRPRLAGIRDQHMNTQDVTTCDPSAYRPPRRSARLYAAQARRGRYRAHPDREAQRDGIRRRLHRRPRLRLLRRDAVSRSPVRGRGRDHRDGYERQHGESSTAERQRGIRRRAAAGRRTAHARLPGRLVRRRERSQRDRRRAVSRRTQGRRQRPSDADALVRREHHARADRAAALRPERRAARGRQRQRSLRRHRSSWVS